MAATGGEAASGWQRHVDDASGASYFYNARTGESSWEAPADFVDGEEREQQRQKPPKWRKFTDDESGRAYYVDEANDVTQWEEPEGFAEETEEGGGPESSEEEDGEKEEEWASGDEDGSNEANGSESAEERVADEEQPDGKEEAAAAPTTQPATENTAPVTAGSWTKYIDVASGKPYYNNAVTGITQWEQPAGYRESAGVASAVSAEYQTHLVRVQTERLSRVTQQALDPTGSLSKLNAILSGIGGSAADLGDADGEDDKTVSRGKPEWQQHVDPQTQRYYYYNTVTGVTQWTKPDAPITSGVCIRLVDCDFCLVANLYPLECSWLTGFPPRTPRMLLTGRQSRARTMSQRPSSTA